MQVQLSVSRSRDPCCFLQKGVSERMITCHAHAVRSIFSLPLTLSLSQHSQSKSKNVQICLHVHVCVDTHTCTHTASNDITIFGLALFAFCLSNWDLTRALFSTSAKIIINFGSWKTHILIDISVSSF